MKMEPNSGPILLETLEELRASTELSSVQLSIQRMEKREQDAKKALTDIELQLQHSRDREITCSRKLERRRTRRLALTSCFSRLTDETMLNILLYVVSDNPTSSQRTFLRLVCKKWSRFFDTTPSLWQKIHVTIPSKLKHITDCNQYCETAMWKSGETNLDILLDYRKVPTGFELLKSVLEESCGGRIGDYYEEDEWDPCGLEEWAVEPYFEAIDWLKGYSPEDCKRWRSAEVALQEPAHFSPIPSNMNLLPNLEALKITAEYINTALGDGDQACLAKLDKTFPNLRELSLYKLDWGPSAGGTITTSLTSLSVSECSPNIFNWIPHCRSLTRLHLAHLETYSEFQFDSCTATLPCLKTVFLAGRPPKGFWKAFDFPSLENMEVGSNRIEMVGLDISKIFKPVKEDILGIRWSKKFPQLRSFTIFLQAPPCDWKEYRVLNLRSSSDLDGTGMMREYLAE